MSVKRLAYMEVLQADRPKVCHIIQSVLYFINMLPIMKCTICNKIDVYNHSVSIHYSLTFSQLLFT